MRGKAQPDTLGIDTMYVGRIKHLVQISPSVEKLLRELEDPSPMQYFPESYII